MAHATWAILQFETGRHAAIPNSFGRLGVACIIPMVTEYSTERKTELRRPALVNLLFLPADENAIYTALDRVRYAEKIWRHLDGKLVTIPDRQLQQFLDQLDRREKKPRAARKTMNMAESAGRDWFALYASLYGHNAAIKRFGRDISEPGKPDHPGQSSGLYPAR